MLWIAVFGACSCTGQNTERLNAPAIVKSASPKEPAAVPSAAIAQVDGGEGRDSLEVERAAACGDPPEGMACVKGGLFTRGTDDGPENARRADRVWVDTFYMDIFEVTVAEYRACVRRGRCRASGPRYFDFDGPRQPITGVSWRDAVAYCGFLGKRLPTEAEWEKAARGVDGELYPWGEEPATCERAVIANESGRSCGVRKRGSNPDKGRPLDVGSRPPGRYGLHDMIGNAWEWVWDAYAPSYAACGAGCAGPNPKGPCGELDCVGFPDRVVRGGSWYWDASRATGVFRHHHHPDNEPFHHYGFRCAAEAGGSGAVVTWVGSITSSR